MRKVLGVCAMVFSLLWGGLEVKAETIPELYSPNAVSIDAVTGEVLLNKGMNTKTYPASMTKVLTALLLMENASETDEIILTKEALAQDKSNYIIELTEGERLSRDVALDILMILSANDVAYAIGEFVGGSQENFAKMMNERVAQLGLKDTHFVTSSGLHDDNHYTTPYEMALITREVIKHPRIVEAMSTKRKTIRTSKQEISIFTRHKGFDLKDFYCAKTGFTDEAKNTLVEVAQRDGKKVINVVMQSSKAHYYDDMQKISDYSFNQLENRTLIEKEAVVDSSFTFLNQLIQTKAQEDISLYLKKDSTVELQSVSHQTAFTNEHLYEQGIMINDIVGELVYYANGVEVGKTPLLAAETYTFKKPLKETIKEDVKGMSSTVKYGFVGGGIFIVSIISWFIYRKLQNRNQSKYYF